MPNKRSWLGIRLPWHRVTTTHCGVGRATVVNYRKERLPWLANGSQITAVHYPRDHRLEFFDVKSVAELHVDMLPFWSIDRSSFCLSAVSELTPWPAAEALYFRFSGCDLTDEYRFTFTVDDFISRWRPSFTPGWWTIDRPGVGVVLVKEFLNINDGIMRAVELSYQGLSMYKRGIMSCSDLAEHDKVWLIKVEELDVDRLTMYFSKYDAIQARLAARMYRQTLFDLAIEFEQPF